MSPNESVGDSHLRRGFSFTDVLNAVKISKITMEEIFDMLDISLELKQRIKNGGKTRILTPYKIQFLKNPFKYKYSLVEIGAFLNTSPLALSKYIEYQIEH